MSFPSLAFISRQDNAGKSEIEPKGAAMKVWLFVLLYVLGGIVFSVVSQNQQQSKWKNSHGINEKSIKNMNLTEKVDVWKGNDIRYRNSKSDSKSTTMSFKWEPFLSGANLPSIWSRVHSKRKKQKMGNDNPRRDGVGQG